MRLAWLCLALGLLIPMTFAQEAGTKSGAPHAEAKSGEHGESSGEHGGSDNVTMWKLANFAILAALLGWFIAKNAPPFFESRTREIRKGIDDAARMRADAESRAREVDARLANLGAEIERLRGDARREADAEGDRIRKETERDLGKIQAQAEQEIASALKSAQLELKRYSASLAVQLARKKVQDRITAADQDALVHSFVAGLEREGSRSNQ